MFNPPTIATIVLLIIGAIFAVPVLYSGFTRRGKGLIYKKDFLLQRAPQLVSLLNIAIITVCFLATNKLTSADWQPYLSLAGFVPATVSNIISWIGVCILLSGLIFMIGGWYSLGECFSTDAEFLDGQTVRKTGLLGIVMHPAYSGIIQSLLGAGRAANSYLSVIFTLMVVAPLWFRRAKYEEVLLLDILGEEYRKYAEGLKWRRLVPRVFPIGL